MPALEIDIRSISKSDIPLLESHIYQDGIAKHTERFLRQQVGEVVYLIA